MQTNTYDFPTQLVEIKANNVIVPGKLAVVREDTNEPIAIVSNKYGLLKHKNVIDCFRDTLKESKYTEKIEVVKNGAQLFATYKLDDTSIEINKGDIVAMQIILKNSYDGSKAFQLMLGAYRLVCTNGMVIGKEFFSYSLKHFISNKGIPESTELKTNVGVLINNFKTQLPVMQKMDKTRVNKPTDELFDSKKQFIPEYLLNTAKEQFENEHNDSVWTYYNTLTAAITHKSKKDNPGTRFEYLKRAWMSATQLI